MIPDDGIVFYPSKGKYVQFTPLKIRLYGDSSPINLKVGGFAFCHCREMMTPETRCVRFTQRLTDIATVRIPEREQYENIALSWLNDNDLMVPMG